MKKILVLMLVLGIASMASAGLSFTSNSATVGISGTVTIGLTTTAAVAGPGATLTNYIGYYAGTVASLGVTTGSAPTVGLDQVITMTAPYAGYFKTVMGTTGSYSIGDEIAVATLHGLAVGTYTINVYDASWTTPPGPTDSFTLTVIPEPMTIGLLGLGGLFLRRRK